MPGSRRRIGSIFLIVFGMFAAPIATPSDAAAQYRVHVYNPGTYNANRTNSNNRAAGRRAIRAAQLRRYCRSHPRAQACRSLRRR